MEINLYQTDGELYVYLAGRVVLDECDRLKSSVHPHIKPGMKRISLDLASVDFIDSAGLGALVGMKVTSNKNRAKLTILKPSKQVSDILMVSKLDSIFEIATGKEADEIVERMNKPENVMQNNGSEAVSSSSGPAIPSMPTSKQPTAGASDSPKDRIDYLCKQAVNYMRQGDYESAANCYVSAIEIDPDYLPAHNNLAIVYEKKPQWQEKAVDQWKKVLELSKRNNDEKHIARAEKHIQNLERHST